MLNRFIGDSVPLIRDILELSSSLATQTGLGDVEPSKDQRWAEDPERVRQRVLSLWDLWDLTS